MNQCNLYYKANTTEMYRWAEKRMDGIPTRPLLCVVRRAFGSALVRYQYDSAAVENANPSPQLPLCNRRKRRRIEENPMHSSNKRSLVPSVNISHLTWRPKTYHRRWDEMWNYCTNNKCPYVPASAMQLLRHLEQGHQEFVNTNPLVVLIETRPKSAENNDKSCNRLW
ncbi:unnamed protein product [Trichobilharzia szidati]|nr:unnamed protein product [Trichobilharzia szidati]